MSITVEQIKVTPINTETGMKGPGEIVPWPTIIILVMGSIIVIYAAVGPGVDVNRRFFGIVLSALWSLMWSLILYVLWRNTLGREAWWLLLIPVSSLLLFFILIIIFNAGSHN